MAYKPGDHNKASAIVDYFLAMNGLSEHWFQRALAAGLWQLRELKLDVWQDVITKEFPVTDRKTVTLPNDFVDWVKIGFKYGQYVITLSVNGELNTLKRTGDEQPVAGLLSQNLPNGLNFNSYGGYNFSNYGGGSLFGIGGGFRTKGEFKIAQIDGCKEILLDYDYVKDTVYVEYITDGFDPCGETILNPYLCDYFYKAIEAKYEEKWNPSRTESSIYRAQQDLYFAEKVVRARRNNLDPKTILNITRQETRLTPHI